MSEPNVERVSDKLAYQALEEAKNDRQRAWSRYIILHWRATGNLAPGCDAKDFYAKLEMLFKEAKQDG